MENVKKFKFDDSWMDKIPFPGIFEVTQNTATVNCEEHRFRQMINMLGRGDSFRSPTFTVEHYLLDKLLFQLRVYPAGQFSAPQHFIVYLILVQCPADQPKCPELQITLTVVGPKWGRNKSEEKKSKLFDWDIKQDRFLRLSVPSWKIRGYISIFSLKFELLTDCWMESSYLSSPSRLRQQLETGNWSYKTRNNERK